MKPHINFFALIWLACQIIGEPSSTCADDWPLVRGDAFGTGVAKCSLTDKLEVLWKYPAGKDAGFDATPIVAGGVVYVGDSAGTFHAVRIADGKPVWTKTFPDSGFMAGGAFDNERIYVGDVNGMVRCLSAAAGEELWSQKIEGEVYAGPTPHGDEILFTCEAGTLTWLNKKDGKSRATFKIEAPLRCTPTILGGRVVLAGCDSKLHVIDVATAKEIDTVEIDSPTGSTPAMHDGRVYFGTEGGTFFAIDIPTDADAKPGVAWKYQDPQRSQPIRSAAAVTEKTVVFGSQTKTIYVLDAANGEEKWKMPTRTRVESSPVITGNRVVAATAAGKIYLLDPTTREVKWEYDAGGGFTGSPAVVDRRIIIGNTDGTLYCFGTKEQAKK
jgi:outer membrane protein assembly factor BamB